MNTKLHFSSLINTWGTPDYVFDRLNMLYGPFELDAAASAENTKCKEYFSINNNALTQSWGAKRVFLNPVYNKPERACSKSCKKKACLTRGHLTEDLPGQIDFISKAYKESLEGSTVVCLIPARTDTEIFHSFIHNKASEVLFVQGRIVFKGATDPAPFPSLVVVYSPKLNDEVVTRYGTVDFNKWKSAQILNL